VNPFVCFASDVPWHFNFGIKGRDVMVLFFPSQFSHDLCVHWSENESLQTELSSLYLTTCFFLYCISYLVMPTDSHYIASYFERNVEILTEI